MMAPPLSNPARSSPVTTIHVIRIGQCSRYRAYASPEKNCSGFEESSRAGPPFVTSPDPEIRMAAVESTGHRAR